jgi:MFS family permease
MKKSGIFYGWWVLVALFIVGLFGPMGRYSLTSIAPFISADLKWSSDQIGIAFSIHFGVYAFASILGGWMVDKIGSRRTFIIGGIISFIGMALLSRMTALWQFYLFFGFIMGLALSMTHAVPNITTARKWFNKKGGLAVGIVGSSFGAGTALLSPLVTSLCGSLGWRNAWFVCALIFSSVIILLSTTVIRDSPASKGLYPDGSSPEEQNRYRIADVEPKWTTRQALATFPFWMFFIAYGLVGVPGQGIAAHVVLWAVDLGNPEATAGIYLSAFMLPLALTGLFGGWLGDKIGKKQVMVMAFGICSLVTFWGWLWVNTTQSLLIFVVLSGVSQGMAIPLFAAYLGDIYGHTSLGKLLGIITLGHGLIGGSGPWVWGKIFEVARSYNLACLASAVCLAVATIALMLVKPSGAQFNGSDKQR